MVRNLTMATSKDDIRRWFDEGVKEGATHMIVICDTYDWEDYPKFVKPGENAREVARANNGTNMQKVMEVYDLSMDKEKQLGEHRAFNY
jgi:hypothetical protein